MEFAGYTDEMGYVFFSIVKEKKERDTRVLGTSSTRIRYGPTHEITPALNKIETFFRRLNLA